MALFQDCSVLFELKGLPVKEKKKIKLAVTDNGGRISFVANKECSLIVTSDVSSLSPGRLRNIVKHQIPVVGLNYVRRCVEANCRLPVEDFTLDISTPKDVPTTYNAKWSGSSVTSKPLKSQAKPLEAVSVIHSADFSKGRGSVIENNRVYNETDRDLPKFPEKFQVAKYSIFQKSNGRSWCLLELQSAKHDKGRKYRLVRCWKDDIQSKAAVKNQMVFVSTSEEALKVFKAMTDSVGAEGLKQQSHGPPQVTEMGSAPLQQLLLEEKLHTGALSPEVGQFVELLWQEALGCINRLLTSPVHKISLNDVTRAEGLLLQAQKKVMEDKKDEQCAILWTEYCALIPLRVPGEPDLASISKNFDLCQLIRDILNVSEMTLGSTALTSVGKYRALRCSIEAVPKGSSEFETVTSLLQHSKVQVHQILRVNRPPELQSFKSELGNVKSLLHSSHPHNFVGILSRGLLLPGVAVSQHGIQRTDAGDLGSGIYFSDDINTTLKYSQCSITDGSRLVLVCDVALGRCKDLDKKDRTLTQAPKGHDSVHGVRNTLGHQSDFKTAESLTMGRIKQSARLSTGQKAPRKQLATKAAQDLKAELLMDLQKAETFQDDEYVVYSPDQVKLKYVVQLSLEDDELKSFTPEISQSEPLLHSPPDQGVGEVDDGFADIKNQLDNVTAGLLNSSGQQIPLQAVHVKCKLVDLLAQVIIFQQYTNKMPVPIEAKYVFPLDDSAAVCGFEAFINGKHVVGQVKEKETARREYKQAIEEGHGAYLMDQDAPDVFTISVGNLPPNATVLIKVTFVSELIVKDGSIFFSLPSSVAPWQESAALNQTTQVTIEKVCVTDEEASTRDFNLDMSIEMPHEITDVKCITHQVKMKKTDCKAVVSVLPGEMMGPEGFQLLVTLTEVHVPRMWVEQHPNKDSQACMLVFYPKFEATSRNTSDEVVLLLDASQSMKGESFNTARTIALQVLKTLDPDISVNVIFFGTDYTEAFLSARPIDEARQKAKNFIKHFSSAGGSTELWRPLCALSLLPPSRGTRNLLLLSDGHIQNTELTLQLLRDHAPHTRFFTCGLSSTANRHMLRALAQAGGGAYEFFDSKSKHTWSEKVKSQVKRLQAPGARSVSVKWQQFNPTAPPPVQAPKHLHALFNDCHTLVFGFVPHCTKATLLGNLSGQEIETMVSTSELQKTKGTFLHKLTARAVIRDFEDGSLDSNAVLHEEKKAELKSFVIELSKEFSILSQFTSFVAIEERDSDEEKGFTDIPKLIGEEDVDFLPYMSWESTEDMDSEGDEEVEQYGRLSGSSSSSEEVEEYDQRSSSISRSEHEDILGSISSSEESVYGGRHELVESDVYMDMDDFATSPAYSPTSPSPMEIATSSESVPEPVLNKLTLDTDSAPKFSKSRSVAERKEGKQLHAVKSMKLLHRRSEPVPKSHVSLAPGPAPSPPLISYLFKKPNIRAQSPSESLSFPARALRIVKGSISSPRSGSALVIGSAPSKLPHSGTEILLSPPSPSLEQSTTSSVLRTELQSDDDSPRRFARKCIRPYRAAAQTLPGPPPPSMAAPRESRPRQYAGVMASASLSDPVCPPSIPLIQPVQAPFHSSLEKGRAPSRTLPSLGEPRSLQYTKASCAWPRSEAICPPRTPVTMPQHIALEQTPPPLPDMAASTLVFQSLLTSYDLDGETLPPPEMPTTSAVAMSRPVTAPLSSSYSLFGSAQTDMEERDYLVQPYLNQTLIKHKGFGGFGGQVLAEAGGQSTDSEQMKPPVKVSMQTEETKRDIKEFSVVKQSRKRRLVPMMGLFDDTMSKWTKIFSLQNPEGYWEVTPELGTLLNCNISSFADDFLKKRGIASLGVKAHADILKLLATLLVLQSMRLDKLKEGQLLRTLFCLEDSTFRPEHWEAVKRAVEWACWADRQYPCVYSRLEFGLSWDSSTKQLLGAETIHHCSPLTGLNLNPRPTMVQ